MSGRSSPKDAAHEKIMRLIVAAIGRLKAGPERELAERFRDRVAKAGRAVGLRDIEIVEIRESRAQEAAKRVLEESIALANLIPERAVVVALDQKGENIDSGAFTGTLRGWRDAGRPAAVFCIGGADGLGAEVGDRADLTLAFGSATWPHQLVRIMLLEQLYRAVTILAGHPYHRA
jgi:23S rRNA (pseudouridine1915-N3)-methyltransferase